jgi:hypothetical protein
MKVRNAETSGQGTGDQVNTLSVTTVKQGEFLIWETEDGSLEIRTDDHNLTIKPIMTNRVVISQ